MLEANGETQTERVCDAIGRAARSLAEVGVEAPGKDARLLVAAVTGLSASDLISRPDRLLAKQEDQRLAELLARRRAREPVSRILGHRDFYGREFRISPATLDPRPDSETLIEMSVGLAIEEGWRTKPIRIVDVGTGSGCLLVSLLAELPLATGIGTDVSPDALIIAAENARRHGVGERAQFETRRSLNDLEEPFDLLVCNPPYIARDEIAGLSAEVRDYDPRGALDGGADGLDVYREIASDLDRVVPCGWVVFEVGAGQAGAVGKLLQVSSASRRSNDVRFMADVGGHTRCVAMKIQL